jgi:hypothetical protein
MVTFGHSYNAVNQRVGQTVSDNTWLAYPSVAATTAYTANSLNQYGIAAVTQKSLRRQVAIFRPARFCWQRILRRVDTQLAAVFQPEIDRRPHHKLVDGSQRCRRQAHEGALKGIVLGHRPAAEPREQAQREAIGDPFAQLAVVPVLDPH